MPPPAAPSPPRYGVTWQVTLASDPDQFNKTAFENVLKLRLEQAGNEIQSVEILNVSAGSTVLDILIIPADPTSKQQADNVYTAITQSASTASAASSWLGQGFDVSAVHALVKVQGTSQSGFIIIVEDSSSGDSGSGSGELSSGIDPGSGTDAGSGIPPVSPSLPPPSSPGDDDGLSIWWIIGPCIGGGVLICCILVMLVVLLCKKSPKSYESVEQGTHTRTQPADSADSSPAKPKGKAAVQVAPSGPSPEEVPILSAPAPSPASAPVPADGFAAHDQDKSGDLDKSEFNKYLQAAPAAANVGDGVPLSTPSAVAPPIPSSAAGLGPLAPLQPMRVLQPLQPLQPPQPALQPVIGRPPPLAQPGVSAAPTPAAMLPVPARLPPTGQFAISGDGSNGVAQTREAARSD